MNPNRRIFTAQVHRFRDRVAVHLGSGETVYLTPNDAMAFAWTIELAAKSCENESFSESTCGIVGFDFADSNRD